MSHHLENDLPRGRTHALAVELGLVALVGLLLAFFADTHSTLSLRVTGFLVFCAAGLASGLAFVRNRH